MVGIIDEIRMPIDGISFQPILVDTKTRVRPTIPSEAQKRNGRFAPYCFFPIHLMKLQEVVLMLFWPVAHCPIIASLLTDCT